MLPRSGESRCINSSHFQVAERALFLWNNGIESRGAEQARFASCALERSKCANHWNWQWVGLDQRAENAHGDGSGL